MSETVNQSPVQFLAERTELRRAYSNLILPKNLATKQFYGKAKATWSPGEQFHGADGVMEKFLFSEDLIKPELKSEARELIDQLKHYGYGFKRDVKMVSEAVNRFAEPHVPNSIYRPEYREMLEVVRKQLKPDYWMHSIEFETADELREFLSNPNASAGVLACYSVIKKKKDVVSKEMMSLLYSLERLAIENGTMNEPTIIGIRLQTSMPIDDDGELKLTVNEDGTSRLDFKFKTRLVNMVSLPRIMQEMHYSMSVQAEFGASSWYAGGKQPDQLWKTIIDCRRQYAYWDSLDYSAYDQSLPGWFILDAFNIIKGWFVFKKGSNDERRWDVMVHDFIHKGLVSDVHGNITRVHDGVESGSMFTQIIDTLCNYMMITYFAILNGKKINKDFRCNICGDDNIVFHDGWFDGEAYLNTIRKVFGVRGNADKSKLKMSRSSDPEYLSRYWTWRGVYRPWKELLIKLIYHERYRRYDEQVTPELIFLAYVNTYPLGMYEGFNLRWFYSRYPRCHLQGNWTKEVAQAVGGIVAYEMIYGHNDVMRASK